MSDKKVVIYVLGGVAEIHSKPDNIEVVIVDFANIEDEDSDDFYCDRCNLEFKSIEGFCPKCWCLC